ncbi:unnamed protein product [Boreogadus saida]
MTASCYAVHYLHLVATWRRWFLSFHTCVRSAHHQFLLESEISCQPAPVRRYVYTGPLDNIVAGVAWLRQNAGLLRGKVVEPAVRNMDPKEQQELLERIQDTDEEEKYPLLFTFDFQEDMEEVFHNMAAEEDLRVNAMFLGRWVDSQ